ncbi:hypothetical protein GWI33_012011 [Rhynchophorus ferrugineus]|uniref:Uncharacterized protein n=1 Tax=Rhynchophorus ferrugineus TaxID=354439 RepID=A0A834IWJ3_RHYFE|nr:hypothetical protein GWI33_012011 [Rhynchophorus ferrugineus]
MDGFRGVLVDQLPGSGTLRNICCYVRTYPSIRLYRPEQIQRDVRATTRTHPRSPTPAPLSPPRVLTHPERNGRTTESGATRIENGGLAEQRGVVSRAARSTGAEGILRPWPRVDLR